VREQPGNLFLPLRVFLKDVYAKEGGRKMRIERTFTLIAAGLLSISLLLSPLAYADHHEGMQEKSSTTEGGGMMEEHKGGLKEEGALKEKGALKEEGEMEEEGEMKEEMKREGSGPM